MKTPSRVLVLGLAASLLASSTPLPAAAAIGRVAVAVPAASRIPGAARIVSTSLTGTGPHLGASGVAPTFSAPEPLAAARSYEYQKEGMLASMSMHAFHNGLLTLPIE